MYWSSSLHSLLSEGAVKLDDVDISSSDLVLVGDRASRVGGLLLFGDRASRVGGFSLFGEVLVTCLELALRGMV